MSGTEMQRAKEDAAEIMRKKQQAGMSGNNSFGHLNANLGTAEAKKAAAEAVKK